MGQQDIPEKMEVHEQGSGQVKTEQGVAGFIDGRHCRKRKGNTPLKEIIKCPSHIWKGSGRIKSILPVETCHTRTRATAALPIWQHKVDTLTKDGYLPAEEEVQNLLVQ